MFIHKGEKYSTLFAFSNHRPPKWHLCTAGVFSLRLPALYTPDLIGYLPDYYTSDYYISLISFRNLIFMLLIRFLLCLLYLSQKCHLITFLPDTMIVQFDQTHLNSHFSHCQI